MKGERSLHPYTEGLLFTEGEVCVFVWRGGQSGGIKYMSFRVGVSARSLHLGSVGVVTTSGSPYTVVQKQPLGIANMSNMCLFVSPLCFPLHFVFKYQSLSFHLCPSVLIDLSLFPSPPPFLSLSLSLPLSSLFPYLSFYLSPSVLSLSFRFHRESSRLLLCGSP